VLKDCSILLREDTGGTEKDIRLQWPQSAGAVHRLRGEKRGLEPLYARRREHHENEIILLDVVRLDEYNDNGDPVYQFSAQYLTATQTPEELKKKKD
jgi:hypothetical protein